MCNPRTSPESALRARTSWQSRRHRCFFPASFPLRTSRHATVNRQGETKRSMGAIPILCVLTALLSPSSSSSWSLRVVGAPANSKFWPLPVAWELPDHPSRMLGEWRASTRRVGEVPVRWETVNRWPSGAPRWGTLEFGGLPPGCQEVELRYARHRRRPPADPLPQGANEQEHRNRRASLFPNPTWRRGDSQLELDLAQTELALDGLTFHVTPSKSGRHRGWTIRGPDPSGLHWSWSAPLQALSGVEAPGRFLIRGSIHPQVEFAELWFEFHAHHPVVLRRMLVSGTWNADPVRVRWGEVESSPPREWQAGRNQQKTRGLEQGWSDMAPTLGPLELQLGSGSESIAVHWSEFGIRRPCGFRLLEDGRFFAELVPDEVFLEPGQVVRHHWLLNLCSSSVRHRPFLVRPTESLSWRRHWEDWLAQWATHLEQELRKRGSVEDYGCYPTRHGAFANGEYDLGGSLLNLGRQLGDEQLIRLGGGMIRHQLEWDRGTDSADGPLPGLSWMHGTRHSGEHWETGHQWIGGFLEWYRCSGDQESLRAAKATVHGLLSLVDQEPLFEGPERKLAWPLRAATDLAAFDADPDAQRLARVMVDRILARQTASGFLDGDRRTLDGREWIWVNVWVSLGITVDSLQRAAEQWGWPDAQAGAQRLAQRLVDQAWKDGRLASVLLLDPRNGEIRRQPATVTRGEALLAAAGMARLAARTHDPDHWRIVGHLQDQGREGLERPRSGDVVSFAKALQGVRVLVSSDEWSKQQRRYSKSARD